ncbi:MAG: HAD-IIB family hydrolase [Nanoarchaeota archaeon]|nr:HAD-IIB family hydrolase [Nanoarchaeota archaeon]MBU1643942.1 HAD-IIB family hydrolase [Nanoarchaeota archaeon]MBU1977066.1 HAD-IIB family hydrolase [Nanoarchaeota archaeon]
MNNLDTAIIVAGGLGTRLRPLTDVTPKPLLPIRGKPIIEHALLNFKKHGIKNIILSIGYKAEQIKEYFGDGSRWGVNISYSIETEPLGTGGAIKLAAKDLTQPFFLAWGDNLMDIDFTRMKEEYFQKAAPLIMALTPREDVENFGVAKLDRYKIISFVEKPNREEAPSNLINAGAFILHPDCLTILPKGKSSIEKDCFEKIAGKGKISSFIHEGQWFPTDTLEKYDLANSQFKPEINFKNKCILIADVDDTICDSCQQISEEMAEQISIMIKDGQEWAFISGTKSVDLMKMISSKLKVKHHILATTGTNYTLLENNISSTIYNFSFDEEEKKEIITALERLTEHFNIQSLTTKEDQIQDRDSQITLSAIGRNAPSELKAKYDPDGGKRRGWIEYLKTILEADKYDLKIGGTTSIDVTKKGLDKEWGIRTFLEHNGWQLDQVLFFGDKIYPGGNDFPAAKIVDCIPVKNPRDTLNKLKEIELYKKITLDQRPWGNFEQYTHNELSTVKILEIKPCQRLSLQAHRYREELWIALDDDLIVEIDEEKRILKKGEKVFIPKQAKHRLSSNNNARVLEISFGEFDENDLIRFEDDYDRN